MAYYESKTQAILQRYGPGPRVHYHTGLVDNPEPLNVPTLVLRQRLVAAQERLLFHAAESWSVRSKQCVDILDVGCGLGGGTLFWAQELGAQVTAITIAPSHVEWVNQFATQVGVGSRVRPLVCNALEMPGESCFDAAVAVDVSSSIPRKAWFQRLASLLRSGGHVFITDCFLEGPEYEELFNRHWYACIGTIAEYRAAAWETGFREDLIEDVSDRAKHFWTVTIALTEAEVREREVNSVATEKLRESLAVHRMVRRGLENGGLRYVLMSFSKA